MTPAPSLQDVIRQVESDSGEDHPLARLRAASGLARDLAEVGDAALGFFVDQARHAGHSWSEIGEALGVSKQAAQQKHTVRLSVGLNTPTVERFTPRARNVVAAAESVSRDWGHDYVGTEHLLLALYREPDGLAGQILSESGLSASQARSAVAERTERGAGSPEGSLPFTAKAIAVFSGALSSALELGHNYIGTEHLLLGLARGGGWGADVLEDAGLTEEVIAAQVRAKLAELVQRRQSAGSAVKPAAAQTPKAPKSGKVAAPRKRR